ncbi:MAG: histidine kinase [Ilumatobacter sp.]|nr:histidine kinase [Ilumatobacter sp.]
MARVTAMKWRRPMPIRWLRAHPRLADLILATALTIVAAVLHIAQVDTSEDYTEPAWWTVPLVVASVFPIAWRRTNPILSTAIVVTAQVVAEFADIDGSGFIGVLVALYSLGAHSVGPRRSRLLVATIASIGVLFIAGLLVDELDIGSFVSSVVVLVTAFVLGDNLRRRREAAGALQERLQRAERERELVAQRRVADERTRIARELHDVVAHSVSVMVIQAAAARRSLATAPDNAEIALANVESTGRQTMEELQSMLGILRRTSHEPVDDPDGSTGPALSPQPRLVDVTELVTAADDLPVSLTMSGDFNDVGSSVDLTGYRIIQESLTNIRRHAGPVSVVEVQVERHDDGVHIRVVDDGRGAAADAGGPGYGLVGMHERVDAIGGQIAAGWRVGGGWSVTADLPLLARPGADRTADHETIR